MVGLREVSPRDFVSELKSAVEATPMKVLEVVGEEAPEFKEFGEVASAIASRLNFSEETAVMLLKLMIMTRLVDYDDVADKVRALEPITRFIARAKWSIGVLEKLVAAPTEKPPSKPEPEKPEEPTFGR